MLKINKQLHSSGKENYVYVNECLVVKYVVTWYFEYNIYYIYILIIDEVYYEVV